MQVVTALEKSDKKKRFLLWAPNPGLRVGDEIELARPALSVGVCGSLLLIEVEEEIYYEIKNGTNSLSTV